jgi:hypothetical protein
MAQCDVDGKMQLGYRPAAHSHHDFKERPERPQSKKQTRCDSAEQVG